MPLIHVLDEPTINQIAAGEVVERPSAVVKELIENAMDAGATAVTAEIKDGGLSFIRITDNGSGIAKEDIPLAFLRHATSKIRTAEDLLSVTSLGFRGEALSSIAAVAQLELITKSPSALNGYRYLIEGGEEKMIEEIGCPGGTTIIVRNLFYNTPARRKFLKSAMTEAGYISDLIERLMISHPGISFKYIVNNQVKLQSSGNSSCKDILYQVYGRDISRELLPIEFASEYIKITGFLGKPVINRGNRNFENYFINGRYIKSNLITKAIEEAYKPFLMQHKYPFTSIYFEISPSLIDVNVHPQKLEIRLKNGEEIYQSICHAVYEVLAGKELIPKVSLAAPEKGKEEKHTPVSIPEPFEENRRKQLGIQTEITKVAANTIWRPSNIEKKPDNETDRIEWQKQPVDKNYDRSFHAPVSKVAEESRVYQVQNKPEMQDDATLKQQDHLFVQNNSVEMEIETKHTDQPSDSTNGSRETLNLTEDKNKPEVTAGSQMNLFADAEPVSNEPFLSKKALEDHKIIGQVFSTYWLVEYKKELYIIDQHAAHEKVLYERIMTAASAKTFESQQLLPPIVLTLTLREQEVLKKHEDILKSIGYEIENFGGNEYSVRAVPADLYSISEKDLLMEFIDDLAEDISGNLSGSQSILERIASLSCKAAVKANHTLSTEEASALIRELLTLSNPYNCPHGRPVIISMSQYELERKFKRIL